jgi:hypothetical protein
MFLGAVAKIDSEVIEHTLALYAAKSIWTFCLCYALEIFSRASVRLLAFSTKWVSSECA